MRCPCGQENPPSTGTCPRCGRLLIWGMGARRLLADAGGAAGLVLALGLVFWLDRLVLTSDGNEPSQPGNVRVVPVEEGPSAESVRRLKLAVTPPEYDDMGKLLDALGPGYRFDVIAFDDLLDAERLAAYDVVFLTCGGVPTSWLTRRVRDGERDSPGVYRTRPDVMRRIRVGLRRYVGRGGTLYASDWQFRLLAIAFPELVDRSKLFRGAIQTIRAEVVDRGLQRQLGPEIELHFDKRGWLPAAFRGLEVTTYLRGSFQTLEGGMRTAPLLVHFPFEAGHVVFTSFHNEKQNTATERQLLRCLVFTTVTAQTEARAARIMVRGGFSAVQRSLLSASPAAQTLSCTYECPATCDLQFLVAFDARGARLRLGVRGPDGRRLEKAGRSTFTLNVPGAARGTWHYSITPLSVPYENFPFTVTVGEKP